MSAEAWMMVIAVVATYAAQFGAQWVMLKSLTEQVVAMAKEIEAMRNQDLVQIQDRLAAQSGLARIEARLDALPCASRPCPLPEE